MAKSTRRASRKSTRRASRKSTRRASRKSPRRASRKSPRRTSRKSTRRVQAKNIVESSFEWFKYLYPYMKLSRDAIVYLKKVNIDSKSLLDVAQGIAHHRDGKNVIELHDLMEAKKRDQYLNKVFPDA